MAGFSDFLFGQPARVEQISRFNPQQMGAQQNALQQALSLLGGQGSGLSNQFNFAPIAQQARSQFQQQTVPGLAERFTSMGGGSLSSPAFASQLGQAGAGLEGQLAALQSQYGLQQQGLNQQLLSQLLNFGGQQQMENIPMQGQQGFLGAAASPLLKFGAAGLGGLFGLGTGGIGYMPMALQILSALGGGQQQAGR